jgi:DNA polymerase-3 subunit epsilon
MRALDGAVLVCDRQGMIVRADHEAASLLGSRAASGTDVRTLFSHGAVAGWVELDPPAKPDEERSDAARSCMARLVDGPWIQVTCHAAGPGHVVLQLQREVSSPASVSHEVLRELIETVREPLASVRAAAETMALYPAMDPSTAAQFVEIIEQQTSVLSDRLDSAVEAYASLYREEGPLQRVPAVTFAKAIRERLADQLSIDVRVSTEEETDGLTLLLDAQAMTEALAFLSQRIENASRCKEQVLRVCRVRSLAAIDVGWEGGSITRSRVDGWESSVVAWEGALVRMTLADILNHHDAQLVVEDKGDGQRVRVLLPAAPPEGLAGNAA